MVYASILFTIIYGLALRVKLNFSLKVFVYVCVCECLQDALREEAGSLCMGYRQPVHRTTDCGQTHCAQHSLCGAGSYALCFEVLVLSARILSIWLTSSYARGLKYQLCYCYCKLKIAKCKLLV